MPFDNSVSTLRDIADAIDSIQQFTKGMGFEAFRQDLKTIAAVERKLLVISEAAIRLKEDAARLCPGLPWPEIRGIGNWLRHPGFSRAMVMPQSPTLPFSCPLVRTGGTHRSKRRPSVRD